MLIRQHAKIIHNIKKEGADTMIFKRKPCPIILYDKLRQINNILEDLPQNQKTRYYKQAIEIAEALNGSVHWLKWLYGVRRKTAFYLEKRIDDILKEIKPLSELKQIEELID